MSINLDHAKNKITVNGDNNILYINGIPLGGSHVTEVDADYTVGAVDINTILSCIGGVALEVTVPMATVGMEVGAPITIFSGNDTPVTLTPDPGVTFIREGFGTIVTLAIPEWHVVVLRQIEAEVWLLSMVEASSGGGVTSVNTRTGAVTLTGSDVGLGAVTATGVDAAAARAAIGAGTSSVNLIDTQPEIHAVVQSAATAAVSANVTLGSQIPGAPTGTFWTVGQLRHATIGANRGAIYEVGASGVVTLKYAGNSSITGSSTFIRIVTNPYAVTNLWVCASGTLNASIIELASRNTTGINHSYSGSTSSILASVAINDAATPFTSAKTVYPSFTHTSLSLSTPVTLGGPIPGTVGDVYTGDFTSFVSTSFGGTMGDLYTLNTAGTAWVLTSAMPDNSYRACVVNPTKADSGYNTFGGTLIIRRSGSTRELVFYIPGQDLIKTGAAVNSYLPLSDYLSTKMGTATLTTTATTLTGAINELDANVDALTASTGISPISATYLVETVATSTTPDNVTIGAAIPGADTVQIWTAGQKRASVSTGVIYTVASDGSLTVFATMPDNTARIIVAKYGGPNNTDPAHARAGIYIVSKVSGVVSYTQVPTVDGTKVITTYNSVTGPLTTALGSVYSDIASVNNRTYNNVYATTTGSPITIGLADMGKAWSYTGTTGSSVVQTSSSINFYPAYMFFDIYNDGTYIVTFDPNGSETINGVSTLGIPPGSAYRIFKDQATSVWNGIKIRESQAGNRTKTTALSNSGASLSGIGPMVGDYYTYTTGSNNVTGWVFGIYPVDVTGWSCAVLITQGATPRTVTWPVSFKWEGVAPVVSTVAGAIDLLTLTTFDSGTTYHATLSKGRA